MELCWRTFCCWLQQGTVATRQICDKIIQKFYFYNSKKRFVFPFKILCRSNSISCNLYFFIHLSVIYVSVESLHNLQKRLLTQNGKLTGICWKFLPGGGAVYGSVDWLGRQELFWLSIIRTFLMRLLNFFTRFSLELMADTNETPRFDFWNITSGYCGSHQMMEQFQSCHQQLICEQIWS